MSQSANARQSGRIAFANVEQTTPIRSRSVIYSKPQFEFAALETKSGLAAGALISTPGGSVPIETLRIGDMVTTFDRGARQIRWIGKATLPADGAHAPIHIEDGALRNRGDLTVAPTFRVVLSGDRAKSIAGANEVLAAAGHLANMRDIHRNPERSMTYFHVAFDQHEIIFANGLPVESFHPEIEAQGSLATQVVKELDDLLRPKPAKETVYGPLVRPEVQPYEARLIRP